jgi:membrane protease YdiL (CAAX protease family)
MAWQGSLLAAALWLTSHQYDHARDRRARRAWGAIAVVLAAALATHRMPGFGTYAIAENIRLSPASAPMTLNASFDKAFAGVLLLAYFCRRSQTLADWRRALGTGLVIGTATATVVIGLAVAASAVRFDPKLPSLTLAWMATNLFLTCAFEEALFRGVLQDRLTHLLAQHPRWSWLPLAIASVLFGLAHAGGGPVLIVVAALAGVGYGLAYAVTGRVESAVIAHFALNSIHFIGFTYPYAVR